MNTKRRNPRIVYRLLEIRKARGLTLDALAEETGVPRSTLGDLETGRNAIPSEETMIALFDTMGLKPGDLLDILPFSQPTK